MININLDKAKIIAHTARRQARTEEFKPYDDLISKQIPNTDLGLIETERQAIREKYQAIQNSIDSATSVFELKLAMQFDS
jgi:hypothetical protein